LTQDEGVSSFLEIDNDGNLLSSADILKIAGTQSYRDLMLAYDDRR
jgi:hypothetical protein